LNPILAYLIFPLFEYFHGKMSLFDELPSNQSIMLSFCIAHVFNDFFFYWTHRMLHMFFYSIHKQHHSHHGPISICAEYAHPFEALLSNVFPTLGGIVFFKTHPLIGIVWLTLRVRQTLETHSGYCFNNPFTEFIGLTHASGAAHHDFHHSVNQPGNFGEGEYMVIQYFFFIIYLTL
jgi:sterol desaturase/sphingolipid hydroxylase (fatty acid hydroxylase superfamily)